MILTLTNADITAITSTIAPARLSTYAHPLGKSDPVYPLSLYSWNARISGAFIVPLQMVEVVVRNAVAEALQLKYGEHWPWDPGFRGSLPNPPKGYSQRKNLDDAINKVKHRHTSKVIPELPLSFWAQLLTSRQDARLWNAYLRVSFPNLPSVLSVPDGRDRIHKELEMIRKFRNRIAHHEHILTVPLVDRLKAMREIIEFRCKPTATYLDQIESVTQLLETRPV